MNGLRALLLSLLIPFTALAMEPSDIPKDSAPLPLFEYGLGAATAFLPDYPGADQSHLQTLPFPYAIYRGQIVRSDRGGGAKARFFKTDVYELNLSASGGLPTDSSKNVARRGMPDLDWTFELGPRLVIRLHKMRNGGFLNLGLAVRAASSTDFQRMDGRGFVFAPELQFRLPGFPKEDWTVFLGASTMFADRRYHQYYFEVIPEFATPLRPAYEARAGYFSSDASAGISIPIVRKKLQAAFFTSLTSYDGSANEASPLMRSKTGWSNAAVLIWTVGKSERLAQKLEDEDLAR